MRIAIAICTASRPRMLRACLMSIFPQEPPPDAEIEIIVVDNKPAGNAAEAIAALQGESPFALRYVQEPEPGIPLARNRALDVALAAGADWMVFIDDDEEAAPGWLKALFEAAAFYQADVVQGRLEKIYPEKVPPFFTRKQHSRRSEGQSLSVAWTHNVAFKLWIADPERGGLRFDEEMRFTGGSDAAFFRRAKKLGAKIVATERSLATEAQPRERLTLGWQLGRERRIGASDIEAMRRAGQLRIRRETVRVVKKAARDAGRLVASPVHLLRGPAQFQAAVGTALLRLARAVGALEGLRGRLGEPYRKIDGE